MSELVSLSEKERQIALQRFQFLRLHIESNVSLSALAHEHNIALRTLQRWLRLYRHRGLAGLARQPRSDRGQYRLADVLQDLIEGLALQRPCPSVATIHRRVMSVAQEQGWAIPSYSTVHRIVAGLDQGLLTLAHQGRKA